MEGFLTTDPRCDVPGLVHAQFQAPTQVALGLGQFLVGYPLIAQAGELGQDRAKGLLEAGRIDPRRDLQRTGVAVVHQPRADIVGKSPFLAHGQEQAAAHAVAQDRIHDRQDPTVGMVAPEGWQPDHELRLGRGALAHPDALAGGQGRRGFVSRDRAGSGAERGRRQFHCAVVAEVAGHGDDGVAGSVDGLPELADGLLGKGADAGLVAADLAAQGTVAKECGLEQRLGDLGGIVLVGADLLDDNRTLALDLLRVQDGPDDEFAEDIHGPLRLPGGDPDPVDGGFPVGGRVEGSAHALDRLADGARGRVGGRALEGDVLHEVGDAGLVGRLLARPSQDIRRDGDRTCSGEPCADDARPLWQRGPFEHRDGWYRNRAGQPTTAGYAPQSGTGTRILCVE